MKVENGKFLRNFSFPHPLLDRVRGPKEISNKALQSTQCPPQAQTSPTPSSSDEVWRSSLLKPTKSLKNIESEPHVSDKKTVGVEPPTYSTFHFPFLKPGFPNLRFEKDEHVQFNTLKHKVSTQGAGEEKTRNNFPFTIFNFPFKKGGVAC